MPAPAKPRTGLPLTNKRSFPKLITLDTITERQIRWMWFPYIPYGAATMIFGPGGVGKSHLTCDLAARITTGTPFPYTDTPAKNLQPRPVLMMSAEDEPDAVMVPRLRRAGADLSLIAIPETLFTLDGDGLKGVEHYIRELRPALAVVDPVVHYLGGKVDMYRANEVRPIIGGLHQLAMRTETAIILVHHAKKGAGSDRGAVDDWERAMGSADFTNAVRSSVFVNRDSTGEGKVFRHVKSNYAREGDPLGFTFDDDGVEWTGVAETNAPASAPGSKQRNTTAVARAQAFLSATLAAGPVPATEIAQRATDENIAPATLNRAKAGMVESFGKRDPDTGKLQWWWKLSATRTPLTGAIINEPTAAQ